MPNSFLILIVLIGKRMFPFFINNLKKIMFKVRQGIPYVAFCLFEIGRLVCLNDSWKKNKWLNMYPVSVFINIIFELVSIT